MTGSLFRRLPLWGESCRQGLLIALAAFAADQLSKIFLIQLLKDYQPPRIALAPFLDIVMGWNKGVSYGWFQAETLSGRLALILVALLAMTWFWIWLAATDKDETARILGISLILGGAAGNLCDRIAHGAVADFFSLHAFGFYWYIFNVADIAITLGFLIFVKDEFSRHKRRKERVP